ncbi:MAG: polyketide cyclase, partial [Thermoanaerobaculia bacterium]
YSWGGGDIRWQLEPIANGTRLTLWHNIGQRFIGMGAAGWHICFDVLDRMLAGNPIGRLVAGDAIKFADWQRLNEEYSTQFGIDVMEPPQLEKRKSQ